MVFGKLDPRSHSLSSLKYFCSFSEPHFLSSSIPKIPFSGKSRASAFSLWPHADGFPRGDVLGKQGCVGEPEGRRVLGRRGLCNPYCLSCDLYPCAYVGF